MLDYELIDAIDALIAKEGFKIEIQGYSVENAKLYCKQLNKEFKQKQPLKSQRPFIGVWKEGQTYQVRYWHK